VTNFPGNTAAQDLFDSLRPSCPGQRPEHEAWRRRVRAFVDTQISPQLDAWEARCDFPDSLYLSAVDHGIFGLGFPLEVGGTDEIADIYQRIILAEEMHRTGSGLVFADLATHWIALPPVISAGNEGLYDRIVRPVLAGHKRICFAVTEPSGGSDVANLSTRAERNGNGYSLSGSKTLISAAMRADYALVIARTGDAGMRGLSLFVVDLNQPGVTRAPVAGLQWYNRNVGTLNFDNVQIPREQLLGEENCGFGPLAAQLDIERFSGIGAMLGLSRYCLAEAITHCKERKAFGKRLIEHQTLRHRLVEMHRELRSAYSYLDYCVEQLAGGQHHRADLALLKITASRVLDLCSSEAMQMLAGRAYSGVSRVARAHRESRIFALAGGTQEILSEMAAKQLGL
jgi:acyl-CoA dehydrogenase